MQSSVEAVRASRLFLKSGFYLDLDNTFSINLISIAHLVSLGFKFFI